jgi:DNA polymerase
MALDLDDRQRAMLQEMGVHVWLPGTGFAPTGNAMDTQQVVARPVSSLAAPATGDSRYARAERTPAVANSTASPVVTPVNLSDNAPSDAEALDWSALAQAASVCQACGLCAGRKNSTLQVPTSDGTPVQADWMIVGDPPDEEEDRAGAPFADQAGLLLDNMLKAVGARRGGAGAAGAYVTNVVKCRPPHGRIPQAAELAQCAQFLSREIALVQPKVILSMGRLANQLLLSEQPALASQPLGKLRGAVHRYRGVPVVVTYHPKVLLRASADKGKAWADLCLAVKLL